MKIIIIGLPNSGRTALAKAICQNKKYKYIDTYSWIKSEFIKTVPDATSLNKDEYHSWLQSKLMENPKLFQSAKLDILYKCSNDENFVLDGIFSPKDFIAHFDYTKDKVIFLNRTDNENNCEDYESIAISVIRDYCFWLASANLISKDNWLEFNFKLNGEDSDFIKKLGSKNTVILLKSLNNVIGYVKKLIV